MGLSYYVLGENEKAAELWKQELALLRAAGQTGRESSVLGKLGSVSNELGQNEQALELPESIRQVGPRQRRPPGRSREPQTIGRVYRSSGDLRNRLSISNNPLKSSRVRQSSNQRGPAHYNLGKAYIDLGEYDKAINYLNEALLVWSVQKRPDKHCLNDS
jgi:tetratricopeptide (TPR) repeat protein